MHLVQHIRKGETTPMSIRRLAVLCTAMLCAGMLVLCRVFWIAADQSYAASAAAQTVSETVLPIRRGNFYDRIGRPLTGVTPRWYALCIPGDSSYATLFPFVPFAQQAQLYARRNSITPFLIEVEDDLSANGVFMVADARRYLPTPIARHLIEKNRSYALFSTHYFELTHLAQDYPVCCNVHLDAVEHAHKIIFLHAVKEGSASQSYGVQVAALAGMPPAVVREARRRLTLMENREVGTQTQPDLFASAPPLPEPPHPALDALRDLKPDELTPREALEKLYMLTKLAKS